ncbi:uncharacterized protein N7503_006434 [Penicillium pulvis]|uniref:uncharacterized protein n=1 Tax=Penicillium pulvis TaxID=1562058 RepID=UPI0025478740|nr:uncharacterized protein N7503_006434 [Penicillium pulvis]KAJ5798929.1 hypothetical protein N7503_006434 [Penicillium pulvis]
MTTYIVHIMPKGSGPDVGGNYNTEEGDGVRAVKDTVSQLGAVATKVSNSPTPRIYPTPYYYQVTTTGPLDEKDFKEKLEAVWNASKTEDEKKPFPQAEEVRVWAA